MTNLQDSQYLIWSNRKHLWWRPNGCGYTTHLASAGHHTYAEAMDICAAGRDGWVVGKVPREVPVPVAMAIQIEERCIE